MSELVVVYRSTGPDRFPRRPPYFDKLACLRSFLLSYRHVRQRGRIVFLNDGPVPEDRVALMRAWGTVVELGGIGNGPSFKASVQAALEASDDAIAYFAEDDYLYLEPGLERLLAVFQAVPDADYVTLYDHLDRYTRHDDAKGGMSRLYVAAGQHWRTVESSCLTFGARVRRLRHDAWITRVAAAWQRRPKDRLMWRLIQGQKYFAWKLPKRTLLGAVPALATHMDARSLAPIVDWAAVARAAADARLD